MVSLTLKTRQIGRMFLKFGKSPKHLSGLGLVLLTMVILFYSTNVQADSDSPTLVQVQMIYRHGDRTPIKLYPNDPNKDWSTWPAGPGQLLDEGKLRHYQLGRYMRERYKYFLSEKYIADEIYVRSTDYDRTLMSALSHLSGLYPPAENSSWNPEIKWQPIPVHTKDLKTDILSTSSECELAEKVKEDIMQSPKTMSLLREHDSLLHNLSKQSGWNLDSVKMIEQLHDTLFIESRLNLKVPDWAKSLEPLSAISELNFGSFCLDPLLKRLRGGPILQMMIDSFEARRTNKSVLKMLMLSAHDNSLSALMCTLGVYNWKQPPYASVLILEYYITKNSNYFIRFFYKNETNTEPYLLEIPGCDNPCSFKLFKHVMADFLPVNLEAECIDGDNILKLFLIGLLALVIVVVLICLIFRFIGRRAKRRRYFSLNDL